jgi:hypothetical protein
MAMEGRLTKDSERRRVESLGRKETPSKLPRAFPRVPIKGEVARDVMD